MVLPGPCISLLKLLVLRMEPFFDQARNPGEGDLVSEVDPLLHPWSLPVLIRLHCGLFKGAGSRGQQRLIA